MTFRLSPRADQRAWAAYQRLPAWQQNALGPLLMSAYVLTMRPTYIVMGLVAGFHAYLKVNFAPEPAFAAEWLSWRQLGWMLTGPIWWPIAFMYPLLIWAGIGMIPFALVVSRRQRRAELPFVLHDPALTLDPEISTRLRRGKLLTVADLRAIALRSRAETAQLVLIGKILGASIVIAVGVNLAIWLLLRHKIDMGWIVFISASVCFAIGFAPWAGDDHDLNLWCGICRRRIFEATLPTLIESQTCPHCSSPARVVGRRPGRTSGTVWDAEIP